MFDYEALLVTEGVLLLLHVGFLIWQGQNVGSSESCSRRSCCISARKSSNVGLPRKCLARRRCILTALAIDLSALVIKERAIL